MMKKIILLTLISTIFISCYTLNMVKTQKRKTANPNTPYIYKNGFKDFDVVKLKSKNINDSTLVNELRFNAVFTSMYTKQLMYDKFGKWDEEVWFNNSRHPILMWENIKLFNSKNELYNIATSGIESWEKIYASVIVVDSNNHDCLSEKSLIKDSIIDYFANGIKTLGSGKKFYEVYWDRVNSYDEKK